MDQDSEVQITLFKKISQLISVVGLQSIIEYILPALTKIANDKNFRIRIQTLNVLEFFAKTMGTEFLN